MKKLFAVLGDPIAHSMSPAMHNDLFDLYGIDAVYLPFHVTSDHLSDAVTGLKALGIAGFNVTVPHKTAIIPLLDRVDSLALEIGAVNTVVNEAGSLVGYNTDGAGFVKGLEELVPSLLGQKVLIIGAGGAARAIYFSLAQKGSQILDITNRTVEKARELVMECPFSVYSNALSLEEAAAGLGAYDVIVQTTSIGMHPHRTQQPISLRNIGKQTILCDIIYNPLTTMLMEVAQQDGAIVQNGIGMFVYQGALAFEKWTGIFPDVQRMKKNVLHQLGGTNDVNR